MSDTAVIPVSGLHFFRPLRQSRIVCAHRGFSALYPENTMASFRAAANAGADMIELDVRFTKDGVAVISHDARVNRCTNGKGRIVDFTFKDLQKLDAGSWFHPDFYQEYIPTLAEVLKFCKNRMAVNIEIKALDQSGVERVMDVVREAEMASSVIISSFDPDVLTLFREYDTDVLLALLYERRGSNGKDILEWVDRLNLDAIHIYHWILKPRLIEVLCQSSVPFQVYTVNRINAMRRFLQKGAAGIITNYPDRLAAVLSEAL